MEIARSRYDEEMTILSAEDNGYLMCSGHGALWCEHIEEVVKESLDAESIWEMADSSEDIYGYAGVNDIAVPLVPTEGLYANVHLESIFNQQGEWIGAYSANVIYGVRGVDLHKDGEKFAVITSSKIGMLNKGEGRLILREMVINWFYPEMGQDHGRCTSKLHTYVEDAAFRMIEDRGLAKDKLVNTWLMVFKRKCTACFKRDPSCDENWDNDLIPTD